MKYYKVLLEHLDFNNDTSDFRSSDSFIWNAKRVGTKRFGYMIVYEQDNKFRELLTGIHITSVAESTICTGPVKLVGYPNAVGIRHEYEINGNLPVYFVYNKTPDEREPFDAPLLSRLETDDGNIRNYTDAVLEKFDSRAQYKEFLCDYFENINDRYNSLVRSNKNKIKKKR